MYSSSDTGDIVSIITAPPSGVTTNSIATLPRPQAPNDCVEEMRSTHVVTPGS